uniref:SET domain-containing protein n=2 Tax=Heterosigma akashiwo TaxID=2829 RepID=A0A6V1PKY8_HETAK
MTNVDRSARLRNLISLYSLFFLARVASQQLSSAFVHPPSDFVRKKNRCSALTTLWRNAEDQSSPPIPSFDDWTSLGDISTENIAVTMIEGMRGVQAKAEITSGTLIMSVPTELCLEDLDDNLFQETSLGKVPKAEWQALDLFWISKLAIVFINEKSKGKDSNWAAWLKSLPASGPSMPGAWGGSVGVGGAAARAELQDPLLQAEVHVITDLLSSQYDQMRQLSKEHSVDIGQTISKKHFIDTVHFIQSRAFLVNIQGKKRHLLIPFMDMFNHKPEADSIIFYNEETQSVQLRVGYSLSAGEQVFINYGDFTNSEMLKYYGFVPENNQKHDNIVFQGVCKEEDLEDLGLNSADLGETDIGKETALRTFLQELCKESIEEGSSFTSIEGCSFTIGLPGLQREYVAALRLSVATGQELAEAGGPEGVLGSVRADPAFVLSRANEVRVARVAARRCARALAAHPTSAAEDRRALRAAAAGEEKRRGRAAAEEEGEAGPAAAAEGEAWVLALRYRLARKELLAGLVGRLDAYAAYAEAGGEGEGEKLPSLNAFLYWYKSSPTFRTSVQQYCT